MKFSEIISERTLADVGVRGGKFYLSARGENMNVPHFLQTGKLEGVQGVSSSKYIWRQFSPNAGRDFFFVLDANDVLKVNNLDRVGYDSVDALVANNSRLLGRIMSVSSVASGPSDNIIQGVFNYITKQIGNLGGDPISVSNRAQFIAHILQSGAKGPDRLKTFDRDLADVNTSKFGDWQSSGLRLNSVEDYANLYYEGAKAAGWYGEDYVKFFAPQNRSKWMPVISKAIVSQANIYADESEWINRGDELTVPRSTLIIFAVPKKYVGEKPVKSLTWSPYDDTRWAYYHGMMDAFKNGPYKFRIVDADNTANQLVRSVSKNLPD